MGNWKRRLTDHIRLNTADKMFRENTIGNLHFIKEHVKKILLGNINNLQIEFALALSDFSTSFEIELIIEKSKSFFLEI